MATMVVAQVVQQVIVYCSFALAQITQLNIINEEVRIAENSILKIILLQDTRFVKNWRKILMPKNIPIPIPNTTQLSS